MVESQPFSSFCAPRVQEVKGYAAGYSSRNALARGITSGGDERHLAGLLQVGTGLEGKGFPLPLLSRPGWQAEGWTTSLPQFPAARSAAGPAGL